MILESHKLTQSCISHCLYLVFCYFLDTLQFSDYGLPRHLKVVSVPSTFTVTFCSRLKTGALLQIQALVPWATLTTSGTFLLYDFKKMDTLCAQADTRQVDIYVKLFAEMRSILLMLSCGRCIRYRLSGSRCTFLLSVGGNC